ncbi:SUKH-3 domain-containing protein [Streptomyces zingiberis]|uniref:SUKH-3 domain containing protein n=1 Tax=Streptomyces zingiberis TaxID=2053010 RepID=A0ABX1BYL9_9ACTN|nr:SUKH-3 domain-containing protein [Streptomyces zingiberis]NJQ02776.1 SUKH-3 domain containing protein [Streptomyces zingiberis]
MRAFDRTASDRFPVAVEAALRESGWHPGRWDIRQAEVWADGLRAHESPGGHRHRVFPAAVEVWAEFGGLRIAGPGPGRQLAPTPFLVDPLCGLHLARTLSDLGRALGTEICPLGEESPEPGADAPGGGRVVAVDPEGRVYGLDHTGDWFLGHSIDAALVTLVTGGLPERLTIDAG